MTTRCICVTDAESRGLRAGTLRELRRPYKLPRRETQQPGLICPAAESGWIAWWPGRGDHRKLAMWTKRIYDHGFPSPFGAPGDVLVCREAWAICRYRHRDCLEFRADASAEDATAKGWRSAAQMPARLARTRVHVDAVTVVREGDAWVWRSRVTLVGAP